MSIESNFDNVDGIVPDIWLFFMTSVIVAFKWMEFFIKSLGIVPVRAQLEASKNLQRNQKVS